MTSLPEFQFSNNMNLFEDELLFGLVLANNVSMSRLAEVVEQMKKNVIKQISTDKSTILHNIEAFTSTFQRYGYSCPLPGQLKSTEKKGFPSISPAIDSLLVLEMSNGILMGVQDRDRVIGRIEFDLAQDGENFVGMRGTITCKDNEIVLRDQQGIIASYFQGPDQKTSVIEGTTNLLYYVFGAPDLARTEFEKAISSIESMLAPVSKNVQSSIYNTYEQQNISKIPSNDEIEGGEFPVRVLSGVQPSGILHIGNYFGAIKQHLKLQHEYPGEAFYFIADYHALTTVHDRDVLAKQTLDVAIDYLALGLDPAKSTFYRQSDVPQVCELMWILACVTGKGHLDRATSYKQKVAMGIEANLGLFLYPGLMASDILAVRATIVPVGEDQKQHLEITRNIAHSFNYTFKNHVLPLPVMRVNESAIVLGIDGQKMSKTYNNTIPIFSEGEELKSLVARIKTSPTPIGQPLDPETDIVFTLYKLVTDSNEIEALRERYVTGDIGYAEAKRLLSQKIDIYFADARQRRKELASKIDDVEDILRDGAKRASAEITETLEIVRECVGMSKYQRFPIG